MEAQNTPEPRPGILQNPWILFVYFVGIFVFAKLMGMLAASLAGSPSLAGLAKLNSIIHESLDVTGHRDDSIVTIWSLFLTFICVAPVGWVYTYTKKKAGFDPSLVQTLLVMGMVVCGMMMLIQDQFSRALALVGVVSAVRFRTNLRDPKDAVYLLVSIGIGMGAGLQVYRVALWMTIVMCITFLLLSRYKVGETPAAEGGFLDAKKDKKQKKDKDKKDKKEKKGKKEKKNGTDAADEDPGVITSTGRVARLADAIEDPDQSVLRPNTFVVMEMIDAEMAVGFLSQALGALEVPWHLVSVAPGDGFATHEYLVRLPEGESLSDFATQIETACGNSVRSVAVRPVEA